MTLAWSQVHSDTDHTARSSVSTETSYVPPVAGNSLVASPWACVTYPVISTLHGLSSSVLYPRPQAPASWAGHRLLRCSFSERLIVDMPSWACSFVSRSEDSLEDGLQFHHSKKNLHPQSFLTQGFLEHLLASTQREVRKFHT